MTQDANPTTTISSFYPVISTARVAEARDRPGVLIDVITEIPPTAEYAAQFAGQEGEPS